MGPRTYITELQEAFSCRPNRFAEVDRFAERIELRSDMRVLELGCGAGEASLRLVREYGCKVVGVDSDASRLPHSVGDNPSFVCANVEDLPFDSESFDVAFAEALWSHVADRRRAASELRRVLVPNAPVMIADFSIEQTDAPPRLVSEFASANSVPFARIAPFSSYLESFASAGFRTRELHNDRAFLLRLYAHIARRGAVVTPVSLFGPIDALAADGRSQIGWTGTGGLGGARMVYRIAYMEA